VVIKLTRLEAANLIERFLDGRCGPSDWDDFTSVHYQDALIESAARRCASVRDEYPPANARGYCNSKGLEVLRSIAAELRTRAV
jgi:hypothetical protein